MSRRLENSRENRVLFPRFSWKGHEMDDERRSGLRRFRPEDKADYDRFQAQQAEERARLHALQGTTPSKAAPSAAAQARMAKRIQKLEDDLWNDNTLPPSRVFTRRLREYRKKRRKYTLDGLAERVTELGYPMSARVLGSIENNERDLRVDDAFALVEALDTAPLYLFTPPGDRMMRLGGSVAIPAGSVRDWVLAGLTEHRREEPVRAPDEIRDALSDIVAEERGLRRVRRAAQAFIDATEQRLGQDASLAALRELKKELDRLDATDAFRGSA
jgi:hypothetical protein